MFEGVIKSFQFYGFAVIQLLIEPKRFFMELSNNTTFVKSLGFCVICSIFYVAASLLTGVYLNIVKTGFVLILKSAGMVFLSASLSYMVVLMFIGKKCDFELFFSVYVFSSSVVLLVSWISFSLWFTEPWKWWLVYKGFKNTCNLSWESTLSVLLITVFAQFFLMYSLNLCFPI